MQPCHRWQGGRQCVLNCSVLEPLPQPLHLRRRSEAVEERLNNNEFELNS